MSKLSHNDKVTIIENFLNLIAKSSRYKLKTSKKTFTRYCFSKVIDNPKILRLIYNYLKKPYVYDKDTNAGCTVYEMIFFIGFNSTSSEYNHVLDSFADDVVDSIPDKYLYKIQTVSHNSFSKLVKPYPYIHKHNLKFNHIVGTVWLISILIISLLIPNHAIDFTGLSFGDAFLYIGHFLVLQFKNLINPALIGRVLINVVADIPIIKHFFIKKK